MVPYGYCSTRTRAGAWRGGSLHTCNGLQSGRRGLKGPLRALARRSTTIGEGTLTFADVELDRLQHEARRGGEPLDLTPTELRLLESMLLGTFGFSVIGTFYASLTQHLRARELMLPLLLFPALVPVFLGAVNAMSLALAGDPLGRIGGWIRLLISFDIIFFVVCVWIFPTVLEE